MCNGWSTEFMLLAACVNGKCCVQWLVHSVFVLSDAGRNGRCCVKCLVLDLQLPVANACFYNDDIVDVLCNFTLTCTLIVVVT